MHQSIINLLTMSVFIVFISYFITYRVFYYFCKYFNIDCKLGYNDPPHIKGPLSGTINHNLISIALIFCLVRIMGVSFTIYFRCNTGAIVYITLLVTTLYCLTCFYSLLSKDYLIYHSYGICAAASICAIFKIEITLLLPYFNLISLVINFFEKNNKVKYNWFIKIIDFFAFYKSVINPFVYAKNFLRRNSLKTAQVERVYHLFATIIIGYSLILSALLNISVSLDNVLLSFLIFLMFCFITISHKVKLKRFRFFHANSSLLSLTLDQFIVPIFYVLIRIMKILHKNRENFYKGKFSLEDSIKMLNKYYKCNWVDNLCWNPDINSNLNKTVFRAILVNLIIFWTRSNCP